MQKLNKRQNLILNYIQQQHQSVKRIDIEDYISKIDENTSKITILRDLDKLITNNLIQKFGTAKNTYYKTTNKNEILTKYNVDEYFKIEQDKRLIKYPNFNFEVFEKLNNIFSDKEKVSIQETNNIFLNKIKNISSTLLKKEYERLLIELSWKSSQIEGNTYSLLDTEALIKNNIPAKGHSKEEATMILNHKKAIEFIFENKDYFKSITLKNLEELHSLLTLDLEVNKGLRKTPVGIVGTNYKPLDNNLQIKEAILKLIEKINSTQNVIEKALVTVIMISYIQPFEDGNKRTGRILANAILYANDYCPLSYRSIDEQEYKKAVILFYENNSLEYFKELFINQFNFAVDKYF